MKRENPVVLVWVYSHNNLKGLKQTIKSFFDSTYIAKLIFIEDDNSENQKEIQLFVDSAMQQGLTGYFNACLDHIGLTKRLKGSKLLLRELDFDYILIIDDKCILDKNCISNFVGDKSTGMRYAKSFCIFPCGWFLSKDGYIYFINNDRIYANYRVENAIIHINNPKEFKKFKKLKEMVGKIWKK